MRAGRVGVCIALLHRTYQNMDRLAQKLSGYSGNTLSHVSNGPRVLLLHELQNILRKYICPRSSFLNDLLSVWSGNVHLFTLSLARFLAKEHTWKSLLLSALAGASRIPLV